MARKYELKRRAEKQQETRRRIVEAAIELHRTKGPARTTLSDVARLAGVERHTLYSHFPQLRDLMLACSGRFGELHSPPDPALWLGIRDPAQRLRRGLTKLYAFYDEVEDMYSRVLRDAEYDPLTREISELRRGERMEGIRSTSGPGNGLPEAVALPRAKPRTQ
jgi:AcrR family transcriptional regulator